MGKPYCLAHYKEQDNYTYGIDTELKKKMDAKLDPAKAAQALAWMEALSGMKAGGQSLQEFLKDGIVLCKAINVIKPGTVKAINNSTMPFKQMENVAAYLSGCRTLGMKSSDEFMTRDLYENANMVIVIDNIHSLGGISRKVGSFHGPYIGVKPSDENKREFTKEQLDTAASTPSRQVQGSYGYQDETHNPVLARQIVKNVSGHVASSAPSKQTQGSYGYQVEQNKNLDKIIKAPVNTPSMASKPHQGASNPPASAAAAAASAGGGAKFCSGCGAGRTDGAKFCAGCGKGF